MPVLRVSAVACALALVALGPPGTPRGLGAQGTTPTDAWNAPRTLELVAEATRRRAVQLADTGLRDYTARANGYVTFLAQFGERFPFPPALIKSDQIAVEVYWGAPDRSKQRIIGRRDTLLLPTDMEYHRDHLAIVQNNFPEMIRLGDGDEVLDVPHPLSALGQATYDYAIADSLAIRSGDVAIDVMMVRVRPKDDRAAAAVGAVYIDRRTASVVRMTFSFTRAALRDRQLEDVSVILENGLVDGRFWLPRRQEIEIRRTATWMDFPARGIIRGRWEICCVKTNQELPPTLFVGPEIVEVSPEAQRDFPFVGAILDDLPDEVRAFDAADVRAVQEQARELVRSGALARARGVALSARGVSDVIRSDRTQGLAVGAGLSHRIGWGFSTAINGRYGTADAQWRGRARLGWRNARGRALDLAAYDDVHQVGDAAEGSLFRNSIAAQEFGSDWTNPFAARGLSLRLEQGFTGGARVQLEFATQRESALWVHATPASGRFEPAFPADPLDRRALHLRWDLTRHLARGEGSLRTGVHLVAARVRPDSSVAAVALPTVTVARGALDVEFTVPLGGGKLLTRTIAAGVGSAGDEDAPGGYLPAQDAVYFGGPVTGPGYDFHSLAGLGGVAQRVEWQVRIPFVPIDLGRFGKVPSSLLLAPYVHGVWVDRPLRGGSGWHPAVGLGAIGLFDLVRLDVSRGLRDGRWLFSVDIAREFWPIL